MGDGVVAVHEPLVRTGVAPLAGQKYGMPFTQMGPVVTQLGVGGVVAGGVVGGRVGFGGLVGEVDGGREGGLDGGREGGTEERGLDEGLGRRVGVGSPPIEAAR